MDRFFKQSKTNNLWSTPEELDSNDIINLPHGEWRILDYQMKVIMTLHVKKKQHTVSHEWMTASEKEFSDAYNS